MPTYILSVEFIRSADIVLDADNPLDARSKIGNFEFDPDMIGDLCGWRITGLKEHEDTGPTTETVHTGLGLAREQFASKPRHVLKKQSAN